MSWQGQGQVTGGVGDASNMFIADFPTMPSGPTGGKGFPTSDLQTKTSILELQFRDVSFLQRGSAKWIYSVV
jgi:hypothetical protein